MRHLGCIHKRLPVRLHVCLEMKRFQKHARSVRKWGHPGRGSRRDLSWAGSWQASSSPLLNGRERECDLKKKKNLLRSGGLQGTFALMRFQAWFSRIRRSQLFVKAPKTAWSLALRRFIFYLYRVVLKACYCNKEVTERPRVKANTMFLEPAFKENA